MRTPAELAERQDGTAERHFPARKRDWEAVSIAIGGEAALERLGDKEAEYLRLVYGLGRPQLSLENACYAVHGRWVSKWVSYTHAKSLLMSLLVQNATCPTCGQLVGIE